MNILMYLLSKSYRLRHDTEYTKEICDKLYSEQKQEQEIYEGMLGSK